MLRKKEVGENMNKLKEWIGKNKKDILIFFSGALVFLVIAGTFLTINSLKEKEQEKREVEIKKSENKKKIEKEDQKKEEIPIEENQNVETDHTESQDNKAPVVAPKTEEDVVAYFNAQEEYASRGENNASAREQLKSGVNTIYQFLFQGGTIHGKTFSELSSSAKLKVLKIALSIDQKIDTYFPNYKDRIKEGASNLKSKIVITYLEITNKICTNHEDICNQAREDFKTMKNSFKISFSLISGLVKEGGTALKEWYLSTK